MNQEIKNEFEAISAMYDILSPLTNSAKRRALAWLDDCFFGSEEQVFIINDAAENELGEEFDLGEDTEDAEFYDADSDCATEEDMEEEPEGFESFDQFFDAIAPKTVRQKVATAAWWLEEEQDEESWKTFDISKMLKGIDQPVRYLSTTITQEKRKADPMVEQLSKSGTSMQAHGTYRLTSFGRSFVEERLGGQKA